VRICPRNTTTYG